MGPGQTEIQTSSYDLFMESFVFNNASLVL